MIIAPPRDHPAVLYPPDLTEMESECARANWTTLRGSADARKGRHSRRDVVGVEHEHDRVGGAVTRGVEETDGLLEEWVGAGGDRAAHETGERRHPHGRGGRHGEKRAGVGTE